MQLLELFPLARDSVADPRSAYRRLRALRLDLPDLWQAMVAITAISVLLAELMLALMQSRGLAPALPVLPNPFTTALVQFGLMVVLALAVFWGGRMLGGHGGFADALLAVVWLQFVLACVQVVQLAALLVVPFLASLIGVAGIVLFFWMITGLIAELHGFASRGRVFAGVLIGMFGLSFALAFLFVLIGVFLGLGVPETGNV